MSQPNTPPTNPKSTQTIKLLNDQMVIVTCHYMMALPTFDWKVISPSAEAHIYDLLDGECTAFAFSPNWPHTSQPDPIKLRKIGGR